MLEVIHGDGNVHHRAAIFAARDYINSRHKTNVVVVIGTRKIFQDFLFFDAFQKRRDHTFYYFTGLGRLYTDYSMVGKIVFLTIIKLIDHFITCSFITENRADQKLLRRLGISNVHHTFGSGLFFKATKQSFTVKRSSIKDLQKIVYVSRFGPSKLTKTIVKLAANLPKGVYLDVVGYDISGDKFSSKFARLAKQNSAITFHGEVKEQSKLASIIQKSDALLYPTKREGCPFTALEALANQTLPILSNTVGSHELALDLRIPSIDPILFSSYAHINQTFQHFFSSKKRKELDQAVFAKYKYDSVVNRFVQIFEDWIMSNNNE